jgi:hypothetical protein
MPSSGIAQYQANTGLLLPPNRQMIRLRHRLGSTSPVTSQLTPRRCTFQRHSTQAHASDSNAQTPRMISVSHGTCGKAASTSNPQKGRISRNVATIVRFFSRDRGPLSLALGVDSRMGCPGQLASARAKSTRTSPLFQGYR